MSLLDEHVEALKRAVAVPGTFATVFPETSDEDLQALLADAMSEAMLDGYFSGYDIDLNALSTTPDITLAQGALLIIYAGYRIIVNEIRNRKNHVRYEAGPTVFEEDQTASMLNELLRQLGDRKKDLLEQARLNGYDGSTLVADLYLNKSASAPAALGYADLGFAFSQVV